MGLNEKAIDIEEARFLDHDDDLIGIQPKSRPPSWVRRALESTFTRTSLYRRPFVRRAQDAELIEKSTQGETIWTNDRKIQQMIDRVYSVLVALTGLGMLAGPLWWLAFAKGVVQRLAIITGSIAIFFFLVAVAANVRIFDALAAAAAYSAVLTVFLQVSGSMTV